MRKFYKMTYKGYKIKLDLKKQKVRFFNDMDDCTFYIFSKKSTISHIEKLTMKAINDRINYLQKGY